MRPRWQQKEAIGLTYGKRYARILGKSVSRMFSEKDSTEQTKAQITEGYEFTVGDRHGTTRDK